MKDNTTLTKWKYLSVYSKVTTVLIFQNLVTDKEEKDCETQKNDAQLEEKESKELSSMSSDSDGGPSRVRKKRRIKLPSFKMSKFDCNFKNIRKKRLKMS